MSVDNRENENGAKVSIICPVFNKERYLSATISSVRNQLNSAWELLLVDDGSSDASPSIGVEASESDSRIRFLDRECIEPTKKGANICRNIGLRYAVGEYVLFLDADDILLPNCIRQRVTIAHDYPDFDIYVFNVAYSMGHSEKPFDKLEPHPKELREISEQENLRLYFLSKFLSFDLPWHTSGPLWRREFINKLGGFDESFQRLQDPEVHTRALLDESIRISYNMGDTPYDVLHLKDDARQVWSSAQFQEKQIDAVIQYLDKFIPTVNVSLGNSYLKNMRGYLIFAEAASYRYLRGNVKDFHKVKTHLQKLYDLPNVRSLDGKAFRIFLKLYRLTLIPGLMRFRLPGMLLYLYKKFL